jgi:sigma-B regulation protein RsbU (phosphoserine phosphatase)
VARAVEHMVGNLEFRQQHAPAAPKGGAPQPLGDLGEIVERERNVAREIHDALINKHPPRLSDFEVEHLFKPGFEIGGDHFEYFRIDDEHLGVILLDTNVRGIPAALVIASARSYVRAAAPGNLSPAAVLKQVNRHLAGELPPGRHVTAVYAVIDTAQGKATMASAGHLPVLVFRQASGKIAKINPAGIAMGLDVGPVFDRELQEGDVPLGPGDRLVLYTDGALRIANENGEEFGEQRFYAAVAREAPKNSQAFVNFVGSAIDQFHLTTPQNDDVTISTVKRLR